MKYQFLSNASTIAVFKGFANNLFRKILSGGQKGYREYLSGLGTTTIMTLPFDIMNPSNVIMIIE